jgi:hypothetical protein
MSPAPHERIWQKIRLRRLDALSRGVLATATVYAGAAVAFIAAVGDGADVLARASTTLLALSVVVLLLGPAGTFVVAIRRRIRYQLEVLEEEEYPRDERPYPPVLDPWTAPPGRYPPGDPRTGLPEPPGGGWRATVVALVVATITALAGIAGAFISRANPPKEPDCIAYVRTITEIESRYSNERAEAALREARFGETERACGSAVAILKRLRGQP